jgi:LytS/YehU family sensor histidine kinase
MLLPMIITPPSSDPMPRVKFIDQFLIPLATILPISFYYLNYYKLIPLFYLQKKNINYVLSVIASLIILILTTKIFTYLSDNQNEFDAKPLFPFVGHSLFLFIVVLFVSLGLRMNSEWKKAEEEIIKIEKEKLNVELSYLKAQINPHFLFNSLNSIYSLAIIKSDHTAEAVMKLSNLMRYVVLDVNIPFVSLDKELGYIENFIEISRLRLAENNQIDFQFSGDTEGLLIAPFILVPFVENAFKHGTSAIDPMKIKIEASLVKNRLYFKANNSKPAKHFENQLTTGVGIENTRKRLEMIYKKNYTLTILETENTFEVSLTLLLA